MSEPMIDFETRSRVDIRKCGASRYARSPSTSVLCLAIGTSVSTSVWKPGDPDPQELLDAIEAGELIWAHNVFFERTIWRHICHERYGWPDIPFDNWRCTLACCGRLALPRSLEQAGASLGLPIQKDKEGHRVMLQLAKPRKPTRKDRREWIDDPEKFETLYRYAYRDVATQEGVREEVEALTSEELKVWKLDQKINLRGIPIDVPAVEHAIHIAEICKEQARERMARITAGEVTSPTQAKKIVEYLGERFDFDIPNLRADTVKRLLEEDAAIVRRKCEREENPNAEDIITLLKIRQEAGKSSLGKLDAMLDRTDLDGRFRNGHLYHGAHTGRWTGSGVQPHNFPRGEFPNPKDWPDGRPSFPDLCIEFLHAALPTQDPEWIELVLGNPLDALSWSLRSFIRAEQGKRLMVSDFASIEARVLAWLAGQIDLVQTFVDGGDPYRLMAADIFEIELSEVEKDQRQVGKTAVLGLGYNMGAGTRNNPGFRGAVKSMTGLDIDRKLSRKAVKKYRDKFPRIPELWRELTDATLNVLETGEPQTCANGLLEIFVEEFENDIEEKLESEIRRTGTKFKWLKVRLPSGRCLHYREPRLVTVRAPWSEGSKGKIRAPESDRDWLEELDIKLGKHLQGWWVDVDVPKGVAVALRNRYGFGDFDLEEKAPQLIQQVEFKAVVGSARKWGVERSYGGKFCENIVQGIARDCLVDAMLRVDAAGYPVIMTVHDEIVSEVDKDFGSLEEFDELMSVCPEWARGCPIAAEGYEAERYKK